MNAECNTHRERNVKTVRPNSYTTFSRLVKTSLTTVMSRKTHAACPTKTIQHDSWKTEWSIQPPTKSLHVARQVAKHSTSWAFNDQLQVFFKRSHNDKTRRFYKNKCTIEYSANSHKYRQLTLNTNNKQKWNYAYRKGWQQIFRTEVYDNLDSL